MKSDSLGQALSKLAVCVGVWSVGILGGTNAVAAPAPVWKIDQSTVPTELQPGSAVPPFGYTGSEAAPKIRLGLINVGGAPFESLTVVDTLPIGLAVPSETRTLWRALNPAEPAEIKSPLENTFQGECSVASQTVTCEIAHAVLPGGSVYIWLPLEVASGPAAVLGNEVSVESPEQPRSNRTILTRVGASSPAFDFAPSEEEGLEGSAYDEVGGSPTAGSHPFAIELASKVTTKLDGAFTPFFVPLPAEPLRSVELALPPGVVVNPRATNVRCTPSELQEGEEQCPVASQVGRVTFDLLDGLEGGSTPLYNMVPSPGTPAEFAFSITGPEIRIRGGLNGDFSLTAKASELLSRYPIDGVRVQLWGNPSDSRHDRFRRSTIPSERCEYGCRISRSPRPLVTMPSACGATVPFGALATSWSGSVATNDGEVFRTATRNPEAVEGCERLQFRPSVSTALTTTATDSPAGLSLEIRVPQDESFGGLATATVKKVSLRLPVGMTVNASAAEGLGSCSRSQIALGTNSAPDCPDSSKLGTAEVFTPLLETPLKGGIYLAEQANNPFNSLLALYLAVEADGVVIKLPGRVGLDSRTGQVTATFEDNPQLPFEKLDVNLFGGARAALATPTSCGAYEAVTELTSWASEKTMVLSSPISVTQNCSTGGFKPSLAAGTVNPSAGRFSAFTLRITRNDGEQNLSTISATLPKGLLAKLAGVQLCPDSLATSGSCPVASKVGSTTAGVGTGPQLLFIPQAGRQPTAIYLSGPYKGAPYSLVVRVPAEAGPFDLGTIAVRVALDVDPFTARVTAASDPLPQILEGIPVGYRDVRVDVTRPEFVLNPTSCDPMPINSTLISSEGAKATPASAFQAADCSALAFKPSLALTLKGSTTRTGHPALKAVVTYPKRGQFANIARAQVNLPHSEFLDQGSLSKTCTRPVLIEGKCPKSSVYGRARAWTPLLERPLEGPVFLVGGFGYKLPALVADLGGQLRVLLVGKVDTGKNKGIRNTFEAVPDAPISRFVLNLKGGKKYGLLENSEDLCKRPQRALTRFVAQNGAVQPLEPLIRNSCARKSRHRR